MTSARTRPRPGISSSEGLGNPYLCIEQGTHLCRSPQLRSTSSSSPTRGAPSPRTHTFALAPGIAGERGTDTLGRVARSRIEGGARPIRVRSGRQLRARRRAADQPRAPSRRGSGVPGRAKRRAGSYAHPRDSCAPPPAGLFWFLVSGLARPPPRLPAVYS